MTARRRRLVCISQYLRRCCATCSKGALKVILLLWTRRTMTSNIVWHSSALGSRDPLKALAGSPLHHCLCLELWRGRSAFPEGMFAPGVGAGRGRGGRAEGLQEGEGAPTGRCVITEINTYIS